MALADVRLGVIEKPIGINGESEWCRIGRESVKRVLRVETGWMSGSRLR